MSAVGSPADNALAGSFNATRKRETPQGRGAWADGREARLDLFRRLHRYNTRRRRSSLGQRRPISYGAALATTSTALVQAAWPVAGIPGRGPLSAGPFPRFAAARHARAGPGTRTAFARRNRPRSPADGWKAVRAETPCRAR
ncbi:integrase core domain-containing protein [Streptomyces kebangsaanensis]|uniref:Integrase core domain-containing protein n=1 Tax=Streptomyces kebangsaanensis TaxID=864058 RepID=A0ABW6KS09_9ACTN